MNSFNNLRDRSHSQKYENNNKKKKTDYMYVSNFKNTSLKECKQFDKFNNKVYKNNQIFFDSLKKKIGERPIELNYSQEPPRSPNNENNYILWEKISKNVDPIKQSAATIYLINKGYQIIRKKFPDSQYQPNDTMLLEPYQLIQRAEEVSAKNNESYLKVIQMKNNIIQSNNNIISYPTYNNLSDSNYIHYNHSNQSNYKNPKPVPRNNLTDDNLNRYSCPGNINITYPSAPMINNYNDTNC